MTETTPAHRTARPAPATAKAREVLERARRRTLGLTDCVDEAELTAQHSPLMSPLVWDLAHVGNQEDIWLLRAAGGREGLRPDLDGIYNAFRTPRVDRPALPLLSPKEARTYIAEVRRVALEVLDRAGDDGPLVRDRFIFGMTAQHEQQHCETMLATHQLRRGDPVLQAPAPPSHPDVRQGEVLVEGGPFTMGTDTDPWALDNERPARPVGVPAFLLDTLPVTNAAYQHFMDDGGYDDPRWWTDEGWEYAQRAKLRAPLFWLRDSDGSWLRRRFGHVEPVPPDEPVVHVSW